MSLEIMDGFGTNGCNPKWFQVGGGINGAALGARFAGERYWSCANGGYLQYTLPTPRQELIFGGGYRGTNANGTVHQFKDGSTFQCTIKALGDGSIELRLGDVSGTVITTSPAGIWSYADWNGLSFRLKISNTVGEFQIYKDGVSVYSVGSLNTRASSNNQITDYFLAGNGNGGFYVSFSDHYLFNTAGSINNSFPGDVRIRTMRPSADTAQKDWTAATGGSNFAMVNLQNPTDNTSNQIIKTNVVNNKDLYDATNMSGFSGNILAYQLSFRANKDDAGARTMCSVLKSGATTVDGATRTLGSGFTNYCDQYEQDPNGTIAWTNTALDALQIGVKLVA